MSTIIHSLGFLLLMSFSLTAVETTAVNLVWKEAIHVHQVDGGRPRLLWVPGEQATVTLTLDNQAPVAYARTFRVTFADDQDKPKWTRNVAVTIASKGRATLPVQVDTTGLLHGVYILRWESATITDEVMHEALLTVADSTPIAKAKDGEFLYGMDIAAEWNNETRLDWADWCGIDVVRNCAREISKKEESLEDIGSAIAALEKRGLRPQMMFYPMMRWVADPAAFAKLVEQRTAFAKAVATRYKGRIHWYEIGNEPDQFHFFGGPAADYVTIYRAMRKAIKAADPEAVVSVAGLCFHAEGQVRAPAIIAAMPADEVDMWSYHAHGQGSAAERRVFTLMKQTLVAAGKGNKPIIESESGLVSGDPPTWRLQARTIVQKFVFAQSTHEIPLFMWFGFHPNWVFGILHTAAEGKPAALAMRVLVQHTRGLVAQDRLDLFGAHGEGYWFTDKSGHTTTVLWSDGSDYTRTITLGKGATEVVRYDLFGNPTPLVVAPDGTVQVTVGLDPVYLTACCAPGMVIAVLPPVLEVPSVLRVVPGMPMHMPVRLRNPGADPSTVTLTIMPSGTASFTAVSTTAQLASRSETPLAPALDIVDQPADWWPRTWTVFAPVVGEVDLSTIHALPTSLSGSGAPVTPQIGAPQATVVDLSPLGGGFNEKRQAFCFASVNLPADAEVEIGAAADYWMEWWVNGQLVYTTVPGGNGGPYHVLTHVFTAHLNQGHNLLAVRVLSGSAGWQLISGGPQAIASARRERDGVYDGAIVELHQGKRLLAHENVRIEMLPAVAPAGDGRQWEPTAPESALGAVQNFHDKNPDTAKWYKGPADLSGRVWVRTRSDDDLMVAVAVRDDIATPGDYVVLRLAWGEGWKQRRELQSGTSTLTSKRDEAAGITWYECVFARKDLPLAARTTFAIEVVVTDDDWGEPKQQATLVGGDDPMIWYQTWLP